MLCVIIKIQITTWNYKLFYLVANWKLNFLNKNSMLIMKARPRHDILWTPKNNRSLACICYIHCSQKPKQNLHSQKKERSGGAWFIYTLLAILLPFTSSKTSNLLRTLRTLFGFNRIWRKRYYTFMALSKIPWKATSIKVRYSKTDGPACLYAFDFIISIKRYWTVATPWNFRVNINRLFPWLMRLRLLFQMQISLW